MGQREVERDKDTFGEIFVREFWQLIKLNLLFILGAVPVFTLFLAQAAMLKSTLYMANDQANDVVSDFRHHYPTNYYEKTLLGTLNILLISLYCFVHYTMEDSYLTTSKYIILALLFILAALLDYVWRIYLTVELTWPTIWKNALLLFVQKPHLSFVLVLLKSFWWFFLWQFLPYTFWLVLLVGFSWPEFATSFFLKKQLLQIQKTNSD